VIQWVKENLGSKCFIAFQSVSKRLPKPALKATKAKPRCQYCKLPGDGTQSCQLGYLNILTTPLVASWRGHYDCKSLQVQNFTHPISCSAQD
jgi:hypothetical protein